MAGSAEKLTSMASKAAEIAKAEQDRKRAEWAKVQESAPEWAAFVVAMLRDDPTTRLLHTVVDGQVIQTTPEYADLVAGQKSSEARAKRNMDVVRIR